MTTTLLSCDICAARVCVPLAPITQNTELRSLMGALGVVMTDAELKVASASVDADGSGDVSFSEFYAWFNGTDSHGFGGGGGGGSVGDNGSVVGEIDMMISDDAESRGQGGSSSSCRTRASISPSVSNMSGSSPLRRPAGMKGGLKNSARATFVKVYMPYHVCVQYDC